METTATPIELSTSESKPQKRGRKITLEEAWEQAGRVLRESEERRNLSREIEAELFLSSIIGEST